MPLKANWCPQKKAAKGSWGEKTILPWKLTCPLKIKVGRCIPYWISPCFGDMLVFGGVHRWKMKGWNNPKMMVLEDEFLDFKLRDFLGSSRKKIRGVIHLRQHGEKKRCICVFLSFDVTIGDALAAIELNIWPKEILPGLQRGKVPVVDPCQETPMEKQSLMLRRRRYTRNWVKVCRGCLLLFSKLESHPIGNPLDRW